MEKNEYEKTVSEIALEEGLTKTSLFTAFMLERFNRQSPTFIRDWSQNFLTGNPTIYMDSKSIAVYKGLIN